MSRIIWMALGFIGGVVLSRNAQPYGDAFYGAVIFCIIAAAGICWFAGYRGKSVAVATAIATATATARAEADARASAIASQAVNVLIAGNHASLIPGEEKAISREIALQYLQQMVSGDNSESAIKELQAAEMQMRNGG